MSDWKRVHWSEAGQVLAMQDKDAPPEVATLAPSAHFAALRDAGSLDEAVTFLAQALPRYEAIVWAADCLRALMPPNTLETPDGAAYRAALQWIREPSDAHRWLAHDLATAPGSGVGAGVSLAMAAFMSGGSIVPETAPPVQASPELAGRLAGAAILAALSGHPTRAAALAKCLDAGEKIAKEGLPAR